MRGILPIYLVALVISAPFVLGLFAYGLAHAGEGAIAELVSLLGLAFVLLAAPPFLLLVKSTHPAVLVLKIIGGGVLLVGVCGMFKLLHFYMLEPYWMELRQQSAMATVDVVGLQESPVKLDGRQIGIKIVREVEVKKDLPLDRYGLNTLLAMRTLYIRAINPPANAGSSFGEQVHSELLSIDNQSTQTSLDSFANGDSDSVLPKGNYRIEHTLLLWGLQAYQWPKAPCRDEEALARGGDQFELVTGYPLQAGSMIRLDLQMRRGYPLYSLTTLPIQFQYEHSTWMHDIRELPIETCEQQTAREHAEREAAHHAQIEENYYSGQSALSYDENPLRTEMCNNDLEAVRVRLAKGTPKQNISGMISECTVETPRLEMFGLVIPALYARVEEREGYCNILSSIHRRRAVSYMENLVAAKLPILCTIEEQPDPSYAGQGCENTARPDHCRATHTQNINAWRQGLYPLNDQDQHEDPAVRTDTLQWLKLLHSQGVPICSTLPDNTNLLQDVVARFPAEVVHYLATIGCDAHVRPPALTNEWPEFIDDTSAAVHWYRRRNNLPIAVDYYAPVDADQALLVAKAMGDLTASEINLPNSNGQTLLHIIAPHLFYKQEEFRYLLEQGVRLDVADKDGYSWFSPYYAMRYDSRFSIEDYRQGIFALLDQLSVGQMNLIWSPQNTLTGEPGLPIEDYGFEPGQMNRYLCERGVYACRVE